MTSGSGGLRGACGLVGGKFVMNQDRKFVSPIEKSLKALRYDRGKMGDLVFG